MDAILGSVYSWVQYILVILIYAFMYLLIRYPKPHLELNYKANFLVLYLFWSILMFVGNYLFYLPGFMAYLPWLNNLLHSFIWVGFCLGWLFYTTQERPVLEQVALFAFTSFIIKMSEYMILGTWNKPGYLGIESPYAYIIAMSIVDGCYPLISRWLISTLSKRSTFGVYAGTAV